MATENENNTAKKEKSTIFTCGNFLVMIYTVFMAISVAALITTSKELESSLKAKKIELSGVQSEMTKMKKVHSQFVKELEDKKDQCEKKYHVGQAEKDKLDLNFKELQTVKAELEKKQEKLLKSVDDLEKVKKEKEKEIGNFHLQITDLRTKQFDTEFFLRDEKERNQEFVALTNEQKIKIDNLEATKTKMTKELDGMKGQIDQFNKEKENQKKEIDNLISSKSEISEELNQLKDQAQNLIDEKSQLTAQVEDLTTKMTKKDTDIVELQQKVAAANQKLSDTEKDRDDKINSLNEAHRAEINKLAKDISEKKKLVEDNLAKIDSLNEQSAEKDKQIIESKNNLEDMKIKLQAAEAKDGILTNEINQLKDKMNELQENVTKAEAFAGNCIVEKNDVKTSMQTMIDDLNRKKNTAEESLKEVKSELETLKSKVSECTSETNSGKN